MFTMCVHISRCTAQHAAVSRGMLDIYAYCPNAPPCMMRPYPTYKRPSGWSEEEMKDMLPPPEMMERYIGMVLLMFGGYDDPEVLVQNLSSGFVCRYCIKLLYNDKNTLVNLEHRSDKTKGVDFFNPLIVSALYGSKVWTLFYFMSYDIHAQDLADLIKDHIR